MMVQSLWGCHLILTGSNLVTLNTRQAFRPIVLIVPEANTEGGRILESERPRPG